MPVTITESKKALKLLNKRAKAQRDQYHKQKKLLISNPNHPSLDFKLREPKAEEIWQFRINDQFRALLIKRSLEDYFVIYIGDLPH